MSILAKGNVEVDVDSLKRIAGKIGIELPDSDDPNELVPVMREAFQERFPKDDKGKVITDELIECPICGEMTDDDEGIDCCPYCGDEGEGEDENDDDADDDGPLDAAELDDDADDAEDEPPTVDLDAADDDESEPEAEPEQEKTPAAASDDDPAKGFETLKDCETVIDREKKNMTAAGYELGLALREVQSRELWKEKKLSGFREFCEKNDISHTLAYGLIDLVNKFDRTAFLKHGQTKLLIVAKADEKDRPGLLSDADNKSTRDLKSEVDRTKKKGKTGPGPSSPSKPAPPHEAGKQDGRGRPSKEDQTITLLAKVGGKPVKLKFKDKKTGEEINEFNPDSYLDLRLSDEVAALISLELAEDGTTITGAVVSYKRAKAKDETPAAKPEGAKRGRGRPPGSKNKTKKAKAKKPAKKKAAKKSASEG